MSAIIENKNEALPPLLTMCQSYINRSSLPGAGLSWPLFLHYKGGYNQSVLAKQTPSFLHHSSQNLNIQALLLTWKSQCDSIRLYRKAINNRCGLETKLCK